MMNDLFYMNLAINLAYKGAGYTSPNPMVGAVIVKNDIIVSEGYHQAFGKEHAETVAINLAGREAENSTLYITLEPCNHYGQTPPCCEFIIKSKIKRVVIATLDPNPIVNGAGALALKNAGLDIAVGILEDAGKKLNSHFFHFVKYKTPFVTLKCGMSLNGQLVSPKKQWITNQAARNDGHEYRFTHDAILVGANTILKDNPLLTCRKPSVQKKIIRIVLDTNLQTPESANVMNGDSPTLIVTKLNKKNKHIINIDPKNLSELMIHLGNLNITSVLVEGGAKVLTSFLSANIFNSIVLYIAPVLIGCVNNIFQDIDSEIKLIYESIEMINGNIKIVLNKSELI